MSEELNKKTKDLIDSIWSLTDKELDVILREAHDPETLSNIIVDEVKQREKSEATE